MEQRLTRKHIAAKKALDKIADEGCFRGGPFDGIGRDSYAAIADRVVEIIAMDEVDVLSAVTKRPKKHRKAAA